MTVTDAATIGLPAKVAFLMRPESYPGRPSRVEAVETHMAWVFLAGRFAYKLKKPVRLRFLDFGTIEARRLDALEELRLNRRLARDVYLGVVPLTADADGLRLGGTGVPVDWLVHMRRLPADRMLDRLIAHGRLRPEALDPVMRLLADFYRAAVPVSIGEDAYREGFAREIRENLSIFSAAEPGAEEARRVGAAHFAFLDAARALFDRRVRDGRIVEGHGDLRPEHVCLEPEPVIFDCLEFNLSFRTVDPADELAFLAMECGHLGAPGLRAEIFDRYAALTGDRPPEPLLRFYASFRAALRARLSAWHLHDADVHEPERWRAQAAAYLRLAAAHLPGGGFPAP